MWAVRESVSRESADAYPRMNWVKEERQKAVVIHEERQPSAFVVTSLCSAIDDRHAAKQASWSFSFL